VQYGVQVRSRNAEVSNRFWKTCVQMMLYLLHD
jgi:hypothetical protein